MTTTFPVQLAIEVTPEDGYDTDKIVLVAYVGSERQEIASTTMMTGYQAKNDPRECLRALINDLVAVNEDE